LAVKIVRQPKKIALIGAPTSAAALAAGHERAPAALRAAGLVERLQSAGFEVADLGDCITQVSRPDEEHPRARNIPALVAALNDLKPRIEIAVKSGAFPLIIGGDCSIALATVAAARRYFRHVGLIYVDRDADMNVPATTPSGCVDGMVISHMTGRGAPELVRIWGEPPLVREPGIILFGVDRLDAPEEQALARSPIRCYRAGDVRRKGAAAVAEDAANHLHGDKYEFILHFDVDAISSSDFPAATYSGPGGLSLSDTQQALTILASRKNVAALEVSTYNPSLDPDGASARSLIELLVAVLTARLAALEAAPPATAADSTAVTVPGTSAPITAAPAMATPSSEAPVTHAPESKADAPESPAPEEILAPDGGETIGGEDRSHNSASKGSSDSGDSVSADTEPSSS
jgi:arginase